MQPAAPGGRIEILDILRGIAVLGILLMNINGMGLPSAAYLNPAVYGGSTGADGAWWLFSHIFLDGKMRTLFTLLFGAGSSSSPSARRRERAVRGGFT